jgi:hypothetical protein
MSKIRLFTYDILHHISRKLFQQLKLPKWYDRTGPKHLIYMLTIAILINQNHMNHKAFRLWNRERMCKFSNQCNLNKTNGFNARRTPRTPWTPRTRWMCRIYRKSAEDLKWSINSIGYFINSIGDQMQISKRRLQTHCLWNYRMIHKYIPQPHTLSSGFRVS